MEDFNVSGIACASLAPFRERCRRASYNISITASPMAAVAAAMLSNLINAFEREAEEGGETILECSSRKKRRGKIII